MTYIFLQPKSVIINLTENYIPSNYYYGIMIILKIAINVQQKVYFKNVNKRCVSIITRL